MNNSIKDWYLEAYPTDDMGYDLNDGVTFEDLFVALDNYKNVYEVLGASDSIIRERVFAELANLMNVDYGYIYNQWLNA